MSSTHVIRDALSRIFGSINPKRLEAGPVASLPEPKRRDLLRLQNSFRPQWGHAEFEWLRLLDRKVFLLDNSELGRIEALNKDLIIIKKVSISTRRYSITWQMLRKQGNEAGQLFLDLTIDEVAQFETTRVPNPSDFVTLG